MVDRRRRAIVLLSLCIATLVVGFLTYTKAVRTYNHAMAIRWYLNDIESLLMGRGMITDPTALERARTELEQARAEMGGLRSETGWLLSIAPYLGWVPAVGGDLAAAPRLLEMGEHLSRAAEETAMAMQPIVEALNPESQGANPGDSLGVRLLSTLSAQQEKLAHAAQELDEAVTARRQINADQLSPSTKNWVDRFDRLLPALRTVLQATLAAPGLLGGDRPKTYLLIAQSNNELRATGGLVSAVGPITLNGGKIVELPFERGVAYYDDLAKRHPPPPAAFFKYMNAGVWYMRDANWSPDFPTTAQTIEAFYKLDTGVQADGVIAFDVVMAPWILEAIGPVDVPEFQEKVNGDNLMARIEYHWTSARYTPGKGQKDFMGAVLKAAILKVNRGQGIAWPRLLAAIYRGLTEKHLLIYLHNRDLASALASSRWDGSLQSPQGDFLMVVDSNLGYNKVNANMTQSLDYAIDLRDPLHPKATVTIDYLNGSTIPLEQCVRWPPVETTYARAKQGCYWDYLRILVPQGSRLVGASGLNEPSPILDSPEGDQSVFATFLILSPGERRQVRFEYELPPSVIDSNGKYQLYVQKQSGTAAIPLRVQVTFPGGSTLVTAESDMRRVSSDTDAIRFDSDLSVDRSLVLRLQFFGIRLESQLSSWLWLLIPLLGLILISAGLFLRRAAHRSSG